MKRIGIYGGSFDPVHNGHLHLAETARKRLRLDEVIFVPAHVSPFKQEKTGTADGMHRMAMLELALEDKPGLTVSDYELRQEGVSYTVHTLRHFRALYPEEQLVLLMGSDMLLSFQRWYCWPELMKLAELGCMARTPEDAEKLHAQAEILAPYGRVQIICDGILPLSSTKIRKNLKKGEDCSCYLPEKVVQYIGAHHLYGR
ncbi:MAG: nicotinate (nicotinamide) nucleotide adenylyltransferase [Ruminococcus sp.]|nr:nicotinate (nicotinamide) nucleotide adenylyltransferase [Ruminococcus sp.]